MLSFEPILFVISLYTIFFLLLNNTKQHKKPTVCFYILNIIKFYIVSHNKNIELPI